MRECGLTIDEALLAATRGGAAALQRADIGRLTTGARADAIVLDAPHPAHLVYRLGAPAHPGGVLEDGAWAGPASARTASSRYSAASARASDRVGWARQLSTMSDTLRLAVTARAMTEMSSAACRPTIEPAEHHPGRRIGEDLDEAGRVVC